MSNSFNPGLWIDRDNAVEWEQSCRAEIAVWLSVLAGRQDKLSGLSVEVEPPTEAEAAAAFLGNDTLYGKIHVSWGDEKIGIRIPMPFHGAFISARAGMQKALVSAWGSWIGEAPGFRLYRPAAEVEAGRKTIRWRMGLPGGRYVEARAANLAESQAPRMSGSRYFGSPSIFPEVLRPHLGLFGLKQASNWSVFQVAILTLTAKAEATDEDDLNHRMMLTFPVWLKSALSREMIQALLKPRRGEETQEIEFRNQAALILSGEREGSEEFAQAVWAKLKKRSRRIRDRVEFAINGYRSDEGTDYLDPINPLDLVSRITRVNRICASRKKLALVCASRRQNHPSFQGRLCPLESPESELVGLSLQLASGATVDFGGRIQKANNVAGELGFGARMIPFLAHNDGVRNMMGAKNLRQAVPLRNRQTPKIQTGGEAIVAGFSEPLTRLGICPSASADGEGFAFGRDLLVAYIPWYGMNFEDAVVVGQQLVDKGLLDLSFTQSFKRTIQRGWAPADPTEQTVLMWSDGGLAKVGSELCAGSQIAHIVWEGKGDQEPVVIRHNSRTSAILKRIQFSRRSEWTDGVLEYELELPVPLKPGDKLMGRHGNKGVVGAILPENQMPRLPDDSRLPEGLRGKAIDILLNPHGVISRMNLGQLIETHLGWLLHAGVSPDHFAKNSSSASTLAAPFTDSIDHDKVQQALEGNGLDRWGRIKLSLPDGTETTSPVIVGFQHIVRLRHIPEMKSQARRGDKNSLYSARTGQAVHGRKQGGGQRVGEMEMWALAAHEAHGVIAEMLGVKSSAELVALAASSGQSVAQMISEQEKFFGSDNYTGYQGVLEDWLLALWIELKVEEDAVSFSFTTEEKILQYAGPWGEVTSSGVMEKAPTARFSCTKGGRKPCGYSLLDGAKIAFPTTSGGGEKKNPGLVLRDLLAQFDLRVSGPITRVGSHFEIPLLDVKTGSATTSLPLELREGGPHALIGEISVDSLKAPVRWPVELTALTLYGQLSAGEGKKWLASDLLDEFMMTSVQKREQRSNGARIRNLTERTVDEMRISCHEHPSAPLAPSKPFGQCIRCEAGGLFDPVIFGKGRQTSAGSVFSRWGVIELPVAVPYPLTAFLAEQKADGSARAAALDYFFKMNRVRQGDCPEIRVIPVLPAHFRLPGKRGGDLIADPLDQLGYAPLVAMCNRHKEETDLAKKDKVQQQIADQVEVLFRMLAEQLCGKRGLIRKDGLGRRVDRSARLVVTPNPNLGWDQAGVPALALLELMDDILKSWIEGMRAETRTDLGLPETLESISWLRPKDDPQALAVGFKILECFFKQHPDFVVLLNRQPTLHREGIQAFRPVPLMPVAGEVIQLCPLTCKGFAADFDGDEMVVHLPLGPKAQAEAASLLPSNNLLTLGFEAPNNVAAHFDQDFVLGTWWLCSDVRRTLIDLLPDDCANMVPEATMEAFNAKKISLELLSHLASNHKEAAPRIIHEWMRLAFDACTRNGVSLGFYELRELASMVNESGAVEKLSTNRSAASNKAIDDRVRAVLADLLNRPVDAPMTHLAAMVLSEARGDKQIRQLVATRGFLEPGTTPHKVAGEDFFIASSLVKGMTSSEAFQASLNARSSMCDKKLGTAFAGGLTRSLVFALWPYHVTENDCGSTEINPATCKVKGGVCAKCHGSLPDGSLPHVGFPAGLIAGQAIGERGTQLSMQSFHVSESAVNIQWVRMALGADRPGPGQTMPFPFAHSSQIADFVEKMKAIKAYEKLHPRHLQLLWKALHESKSRTLRSAIQAADPVMRLSHDRRPDTEILVAAIRSNRCRRDVPFASILFGAPSKHTPVQTP